MCLKPELLIIQLLQIKYAKLIIKIGGDIKLNSKAVSIKVNCNQIVVQTEEDEFKSKYLVNCGGLYSDKIAKMSGVNPDVKIIPFRGEYYELKKRKATSRKKFNLSCS